MSALTIAACVVGYWLVGVVFVGIIVRLAKKSVPDKSSLIIGVLFWPVILVWALSDVLIDAIAEFRK